MSSLSLSAIDVLLAHSELTEEEAIQAGDDVKQAILDRLGW